MIPNCLNCGTFSPFCLSPFQTSSSPEKWLLFLDVVNTCLELTGSALVCTWKCRMNCFTFPQSPKAHTCRNFKQYKQSKCFFSFLFTLGSLNDCYRSLISKILGNPALGAIYLCSVLRDEPLPILAGEQISLFVLLSTEYLATRRSSSHILMPHVLYR